MFAIVKFGNQQFKVKAGDFIRAPFQNLSPGESLEVPVLCFGADDNLVWDKKQLEQALVKVTLLRQSLAKKVIVFKKKRRKGYRRTNGHRQKVSELRIIELCSPDGKVYKMEKKTHTATLDKSEGFKKNKQDIKASKKLASSDFVKNKKTVNNPSVKSNNKTDKAGD